MFVTMLLTTRSMSIPTFKFLMLPTNATLIMQPLDQGIILSAKRRYKKKLAERYLACVENNKDANSLPQSPRHCASYKHDCCIVERNLFYHHPELFLQSMVQTPCSRPCTLNRGSPTCASTRCMEQGSKVVR